MSKINNWMLSKAAAWKSRDVEEGQGLAEYGLILALISVVCIIALGTLGGKVNDTLTSIGNGF